MNNIFKALNDKTRREILELLKEKDLSAGEIAKAFHISKPSISHHLDLLKRAELVSSVKKGQFVMYSMNTTVMEDVLQWMIALQPKEKIKNKIKDMMNPLSDIASEN